MNEQQSRIYKVLDYIHSNLNENLPLDVLAEKSTYSSFHFHRLFAEVMQETPADYVKRVRLEKAAHMLIYEPHVSVTEIAYECGFGSLSYFTTAFKDTFQNSPKAWREGGYLERFSKPYLHSKKSKQMSKNQKESGGENPYNQIQRLNLEKVTTVELPERTFVFAPHFGAYSEDIAETWEQVYSWVKARNLLSANSMIIGLPQNNPYITPHDKCRYDCCISIPGELSSSEQAASVTIPGGRYVFYEFEEPVAYEDRQLLIECYAEIYSIWLPRSGYRYLGNPVEIVQVEEVRGTLDLLCRIKSIALPIEPK
ncbi:GyrI-like domain-containing protein [Fictibacillus aquaticus]|uniref:AraC family transcriptional regulator n=1 Tax=Fictibacillus aquaticus TaxID=2021314 RepID=A0A235F7N3_9BACL|nr:helix-turn-helix domain-containing protein [Fictibacillus aquaticus]OYD57258.1 AraC family transcriptional regulator [Fictibacillus aquaticus]